MKRTAAAATALLLGCAGATTHLADSPDYAGPEITSIAVVDAGVLADAVRVELANRGFLIPDATANAQALLHVSGSGDYQGLPQSAAIRLVSPEGALIAAATWNNGWGGASGSIADRLMRQGAPDAARQIVDALCQKIAPAKARKPEDSKLHSR